jgi:glycerol-3-phosphate dehydrogenase (NAD(P)+)
VVEAAVMGAGAWGTALAKVLADAGSEVTLWARRGELADEINDTHRNAAYLGDVELPKTIRATGDPAVALAGACTVLFAVPSQTLRTNLEQWRDHVGGDTTLVSVAKGIELNTLMRMSQVIMQVTGAGPDRVAVVTGPNLASEIVDEQPAATVVACADSGRAVTLQRAFSTGYFRPYTNSDVVGAEVERHRPGLRHGRGRWPWGEHRCGDHHPRSRRDHAAGNRVGRQGRHARGTGRRR